MIKGFLAMISDLGVTFSGSFKGFLTDFFRILEDSLGFSWDFQGFLLIKRIFKDFQGIFGDWEEFILV